MEFYHTLDWYNKEGVHLFVEHAQAYRAGQRTIPVSQTTSQSGLVTFTFSNELLEAFVTDTRRLEKPYEVALKYGFRGFSKGGKNGIFYQRPQDVRMMAATDRLAEKNLEQIVADLAIARSQVSELKRVKGVYHNPEKDRLVGVFNEENKRIIFLGFARY